MNLAPTSLLDLLSASAAVRLGWVCIHSVWQTAAVATLLAVALRLIPRRSTAALNARYLLAVTALFAMPALAGATFLAVPGEHTSDHGLTGPAAAAVAGMPGAQAVLVMPHGTGAANSSAAPSSHAAVAVLARDLASRVEPWLPVAAAAWVAGMLVAAVRMMAGWALTRRLVARATAVADGRWQARVNRWRRSLDIDGMVLVLASDAIGAPVVVGWLKPVILWPAGVLVGMAPQEIDAIIAHELAHVRRRDVLVNLLQACIDVLFFHHPAAWWISAQVRGEREHCADDLAVRALERDRAGTRLSYARALVSLEERRMGMAFAVAADGGSLVDRIRRLAGVEAPQASAARLVAGVLATACMVAVVAAGAGAPRPALAAEEQALPTDTNAIKTLTPALDTGLARAMDEMPKNPKELKTLTVEQATALARSWGVCKTGRCGPPRLALDSLTTLSEEVATAIARFHGYLSFDGLTTLSGGAAKALARHAGVLSLNGLTTLSDEVAKALAQHDGGGLRLDGLTTLSDEAAKALGQTEEGSLSLNGLTTLSDQAAEALAQKNIGLSLNGLTTLSDEAARALAQAKVVALNGLTTLSGEAAKALAQMNYGLSLNGLTALSKEAAEGLAQGQSPWMELNGLTTLSADAAQALAEYERGLSLDGLTTLSDEAAKALGQHKGYWLRLKGLTTLSDEAAKALFTVDRVEVPDRLANEFAARHPLSPDTAPYYAGGGLRRHLMGLTTLSPEVATALAQTKGLLNLCGLTTLSDAAAGALAQHEGDLFLDGLTTLSDTAAKALAQHKGGRLHLRGLTTLSDDAAQTLATHADETKLLAPKLRLPNVVRTETTQGVEP